MCVTELAEAERETISTISQLLRILRVENLVLRQRCGKHINHGLADQHVMEIVLVFSVLEHATERLAGIGPAIPNPH